MVYMPRKSKDEIVTRTLRLSKEVADMLDLYAEDQDWSANAAANNSLKRYLTGLGYKERVSAANRGEVG